MTRRPAAGPGCCVSAGRRWPALPLVPLGLVYLNLSRRGGPLRPEWGYLTHPLSPRAWAAQLTWVDPISIASKTMLPFSTTPSRAAGLLAGRMATGGARPGRGGHARHTPRRPRDRLSTGLGGARGALIAGGIAAPDTLGSTMAITCLDASFCSGWRPFCLFWTSIPGDGRSEGASRRWSWPSRPNRRWVRPALESRRPLRATFWQHAALVGQRQRVATLLLRLKLPGRPRANPLLHADCLLGIGTGNVIWSNYETRHYYFPVQLFPAGLDQPDAGELEAIASRMTRATSPPAPTLGQLLSRHHAAIDVLVIWGREPGLDAITAHWFRPVTEDGLLRYPPAPVNPDRLLERTTRCGRACSSTMARQVLSQVRHFSAHALTIADAGCLSHASAQQRQASPGLAGILHQVAAALHHGRRERTERLAVHRQRVDLCMDLAITRPLAELLEAVGGRLVARAGALTACLHAVFVGLVVVVMMFLVSARPKSGIGWPDPSFLRRGRRAARVDPWCLLNLWAREFWGEIRRDLRMSMQLSDPGRGFRGESAGSPG